MKNKVISALIALLAFVAVSAMANAQPIKAEAATGYQSSCNIYYTYDGYGRPVTITSQCFQVDTNPNYNGLQRMYALCVNNLTGSGTTVTGPWVLVGSRSVAYCPYNSHVYPGAYSVQRL